MSYGEIRQVQIVPYAVLLWVNPVTGKSEIAEFQDIELDAVKKAKEELEENGNS